MPTLCIGCGFVFPPQSHRLIHKAGDLWTGAPFCRRCATCPHWRRRSVAGRAVPDRHPEITSISRRNPIVYVLSQKPDRSVDLRTVKNHCKNRFLYLALLPVRDLRSGRPPPFAFHQAPSSEASGLQPASALDIRVAVHQRHRKLFGLDVDADCAAALKPAESQFAITQVVRRGGVG